MGMATAASIATATAVAPPPASTSAMLSSPDAVVAAVDARRRCQRVNVDVARGAPPHASSSAMHAVVCGTGHGCHA
jgi:hypothetical protein